MLTLAALNGMQRAEFVATLGGIFEHSPWIAEAVAPTRPFASIEALHAAMVAAVTAASKAQQLDLIQAHPDLAGRAARAGTLTADSTREQSSVGLDRLSEEEYERFNRLNTAYRERFGFPFIICVRKTDKAGIFRAYEQRVQHDRESEIACALSEIGEIARLRLAALLAPGD